jgi:hypothetical protein
VGTNIEPPEFAFLFLQKLFCIDVRGGGKEAPAVTLTYLTQILR